MDARCNTWTLNERWIPVSGTTCSLIQELLQLSLSAEIPG